MYTLYDNTLVQQALASATIQTGTTNGIAIDTGVYGNNFRDVLFVISSGTLTDGSYAVTAQESDSSGSGFVAAARVLGLPPTFALTDDNVWNSLGVLPTKRYVRLVVTATGATTGGVLSATAVLGSGSNGPVARA